MIEGLKLRVTSEELRDHCCQRALHHRSRASSKEAELPTLRESLEKLKPEMAAMALTHMNKSSSNYHADPEELLENLERDIRDHRNKALVFEFFAAHLFEEDYTLQENDLVRLEILANR